MINFIIAWTSACIFAFPIIVLGGLLEKAIGKEYRTPIDFSNNRNERH